MAEYYLISQFPSLDGLGETMPVPITEERFLELCNRFLGKKAMKEVEQISLVPPIDPEKTSSAVIRAWNDGERKLRLALAKVRAEKLNKSFESPSQVLSAELSKVANAAADIENPLEAENFLLHYRLSALETLRPMDNFSEEFVFYYALKLKLITRIRQFDAALGKATYHNIYNSILDGDRLEAE